MVQVQQIGLRGLGDMWGSDSNDDDGSSWENSGNMSSNTNTSTSTSGSDNEIRINIEQPKPPPGMFDTGTALKAGVVGIGVLAVFGIGWALLSK